jgi:ribonuclease HII
MPLPKSTRCGTKYERNAWRGGYAHIAGVDEVGVGSLFGPVFAAAVILDPARPIRGLKDSKLLPAERREKLAVKIRATALAWSIGIVDAAEVDRINIYQAARLAMRQAVMSLNVPPDMVLVDARRLDIELPQIAIIGGDRVCASIAAASIVAKVERDALMREWDRVFPQYGLASHKGYSTPAHKKVLREFGPTPLHRLSYLPVRSAAGAAAMINNIPEIN